MNYHIPPKTSGRHCDAHLFPEPPKAWLYLPKMQQFLGLGWHRHLPPEAGVLFTSLMILEHAECPTAKEQSHWLKLWHEQARNAGLTPQQACAKEDVERRFNQEYGRPWSDTLTGLLTLLEDLGLIVPNPEDESGIKWYRIANVLPAPEERLNLSEAEKTLLTEVRARHS